MRMSLLEREVIKDRSGADHQAIDAIWFLEGGFSAG